MSAVKFQSEATRASSLASSESQNRFTCSQESKIATLESIILSICLNSSLSQHDETLLDSIFPQNERLFIAKDSSCVYPAGALQSEFSLCLVIQDSQISVCDLYDNHPVLVDRIESAWPSLAIALRRISESFERVDAAMVINRTSGRIIAVNKGFTDITGLSKAAIVGGEYGETEKILKQFFAGKKLSLENFASDEVHLILVSFNSANTTKQFKKVSDTNPQPDFHRFIEEPQAIGIHISRFNALLENDLHNAINSETLEKLELVISEMNGIVFDKHSSGQVQIESTNFKACLRLLIQSVLMSHRSLAGESARTNILIYRDGRDALQIRFDTPSTNKTLAPSDKNEWWQLVDELSKRIGVKTGELKFNGNSIINRIYLST